MLERNLAFRNYGKQEYLGVLSSFLDEGRRRIVLVGQDGDPSAGFEKAARALMAKHADAAVLRVEWPSDPRLRDADGAFVMEKDAARVSAALAGLAPVDGLAVCAPMTTGYFKSSYTFVIAVPKAGAHMLMGLLAAFGFDGPGDTTRIRANGSFYFLNGIDQHTEAAWLSLYHAPPEQLEAFFARPALFLFRDPRDIAVSLAHFLGQPPPQFLERDGIPRLFHALHPFFSGLGSDAERLSLVIDGAPVLGSIREFVMPFAPWLDMPNILPIRYEDLVGPRGGGSAQAQLDAIWRLQLVLQVPGRPRTFAERVYDSRSPTFREGQIGAYLTDFRPQDIEKFRRLPDDFMTQFGYGWNVTPARSGGRICLIGARRADATALAQALRQELALSGISARLAATPPSAATLAADDGDADAIDIAVLPTPRGFAKSLGSPENRAVACYPGADAAAADRSAGRPGPDTTVVRLGAGRLAAAVRDVIEMQIAAGLLHSDARQRQLPLLPGPLLATPEAVHDYRPQLLGDHGDFNFVGYDKKYYAIRQEMGPLDLTTLSASRLADHILRGEIFVADSVDMLRLRVETLTDLGRISELTKKMEDLIDRADESPLLGFSDLPRTVENLVARAVAFPSRQIAELPQTIEAMMEDAAESAAEHIRQISQALEKKVQDLVGGAHRRLEEIESALEELRAAIPTDTPKAGQIVALGEQQARLHESVGALERGLESVREDVQGGLVAAAGDRRLASDTRKRLDDGLSRLREDLAGQRAARKKERAAVEQRNEQLTHMLERVLARMGEFDTQNRDRNRQATAAQAARDKARAAELKALREQQKELRNSILAAQRRLEATRNEVQDSNTAVEKVAGALQESLGRLKAIERTLPDLHDETSRRLKVLERSLPDLHAETARRLGAIERSLPDLHAETADRLGALERSLPNLQAETARRLEVLEDEIPSRRLLRFQLLDMEVRELDGRIVALDARIAATRRLRPLLEREREDRRALTRGLELSLSRRQDRLRDLNQRLDEFRETFARVKSRPLARLFLSRQAGAG